MKGVFNMLCTSIPYRYLSEGQEPFWYDYYMCYFHLFRQEKIFSKLSVCEKTAQSFTLIYLSVYLPWICLLTMIVSKHIFTLQRKEE